MGAIGAPRPVRICRYLKCAFEDGFIVDNFNTARVHGHIVHGGCPRASGSTSGSAEVRGSSKLFLLKAYPRASPAALGLSREFADRVRKALRSRSNLIPVWDMSLGDHTPVEKFEALLDTETGVNPSVSERTQQIGLVREPVWLQQNTAEWRVRSSVDPVSTGSVPTVSKSQIVAGATDSCPISGEVIPQLLLSRITFFSMIRRS